MAAKTYGFVLACVLMAHKTLSIEKGPYLQEMCQQFRSASCPHRYSSKHHYCSLTFSNTSVGNRESTDINIYMNKMTKKSFTDPNVIRTPNSSVLQEKEKTEKTETTSNDDFLKYGTGLLVAPYIRRRRAQFLHFDLSNHRIKQFLTLRGVEVLCIAYASMHKTVIFGIKYPNKILTYNEKTQQSKTIRYGVTANCIAVDDKREHVFFTMDAPQKGVYGMALDGKDRKKIADRSCAVSLILDTNRKTIYACCSVSLFSVSYNGQNNKPIDPGSVTSAMAFDKTFNYIYYNHNKDIYRYSMVKKNKVKVASIRFIAADIVLYVNHLYVSSEEFNGILIINLSSHKVTQIELSKGAWIRICLYEREDKTIIK